MRRQPLDCLSSLLCIRTYAPTFLTKRLAFALSIPESICTLVIPEPPPFVLLSDTSVVIFFPSFVPARSTPGLVSIALVNQFNHLPTYNNVHGQRSQDNLSRGSYKYNSQNKNTAP